MQTQLATVTQKGQVTIPVDFRNMLGIKPYSKVTISVSKRAINIEPTLDIMDLAGTFKIPKGTPGVLEAREYMEKHYKRF